MTRAITIRDLKKRFGRRQALDGLSLEIPKGSIFGLVGQNGAGKTTAFSILSGALKPDSGHIDILDSGPFDPIRHKGRITVLPQDASLPGYARIDETLAYFARLQGLSAPEAQKSAAQVLEWVSLSDRAKSPIRTLSHGMLRRVTVAQAFLGNPDIVLLDEPTSGLDPKQVVQIRELLLLKKGRQTIIVSSHILSEIEAACDNVAFIEKGKTLRQDTLESLINRDQIINYILEPGDLPIEAIQALLPSANISLSDSGSILKVHLMGDSLSPSDINRILLPALMAHHIGIREIKLGSNLEQEYLKQL